MCVSSVNTEVTLQSEPGRAVSGTVGALELRCCDSSMYGPMMMVPCSNEFLVVSFSKLAEAFRIMVRHCDRSLAATSSSLG